MSTEPERPTREECIRDAARALVRGLALYGQHDDRRDDQCRSDEAA